MSIPNCLHIVNDLRDRFPDEWRNAHTGNAQTEDFIRRLAWVLHDSVDPRFGLLGQRGDPNRIGDDVVLYTGEGPGRDPLTGAAVSAFDVIVGAGGPNPQAGWGFINQGGSAAWVKPEPVGDSGSGGGGTPTPPQPPPAPDYMPKLNAIATALADIYARLAVVEREASAAATESLNAASRASEIKTQIANLPAPDGGSVAFPDYAGRIFGAGVTLRPVAK